MESKKMIWPDEARLEMIDKSEWYESPAIYQYGYYDGYQKAISELASKDAEIERLKKLLDEVLKGRDIAADKFAAHIDRDVRERAAKDALIKQMLEALEAAEGYRLAPLYQQWNGLIATQVLAAIEAAKGGQ